jgi:hypothetical protein
MPSHRCAIGSKHRTVDGAFSENCMIFIDISIDKIALYY